MMALAKALVVVLYKAQQTAPFEKLQTLGDENAESCTKRRWAARLTAVPCTAKRREQ
jgi:hypothetical protein